LKGIRRINVQKAACVVGSAGGIGRAVVQRLKSDGWDPVVEMDLEGAIAVDITDQASVEAAFQLARQTVPKIYLYVHAAGTLDLGTVESTSLEQWQRTIAINLTGPFLCCKAASGWIADNGRVVLISSLAGRTGGVLTGTAYAASKGGLESFAKSMAQQVAARGITVNCVAPGGVDTPMLAKNSAKARAGMAAATPLGRIAQPEEIAAAIAFLGSEGASFITGAVVPVNGGLRMD
jgi:NAD(P)-dependent dehydrogenase (short-subunit alcohol dehydrogenase family)